MHSSLIAKTLSHNLRLLRAELALTQGQLAKKAGITSRSYQNLESGTGNPTLSTIDHLARALEVTASKLISLDHIRITGPVDKFIARFHDAFENAPIGASIRDFDGILLYRNSKFRKSFPAPERSDGTIDLFAILPKGSKETLRSQLVSERRGMTGSYVNFWDCPDTKELRIFRFYPCLVANESGSKMFFSALYTTPPADDCQMNYYKFCKTLLTTISP